MGSGSSRGGSQLVVAKTGSKAKQNEHQTHVRKEPPKLTESQAQVAKSNMKKQYDKPTQVHTTTENNNESSRGEGNVKQTTAKTGVVSGPTKTATAENNSESSNGEGNLKQTTTDSDVANDSTKLTMAKTVQEKPDCAGLLTSYCEKYPQIEGSLTKTLGYFQNLKELLDSGNMISPKSVEIAKGFFVLLDNVEARSDKARLTDFTVSLGTSKLFCDTLTHLRTQYPELNKWDRAEDLEKKETKTTPASDQDESQEKEKVDREKELTIAQDTVNLLAGSVLDFSDLHDDYCVACGQAGMVPVFVEMAKELEGSIAKNVRFQDPETQRLTMYTTRGKMLSRVMGGLHNLSKRVPVRSSFSACGAVEVLIPFLKAEVTLYATKALLILAYLIDEQNNHLIMSDKGPIKFLTNSLDKSLRSSRHRYLGFSSAELAEGLTQIALNDSNKKTIAECGAIPILAKMLKNAKEDEEKVNGCNTLWTLAFDAENRNLIKNDASAVTELRILASHGNSEIRKAASGALWEIEGKEKHSRLKLSKVNQPATASAASTGAEEIQNVADTKHIMISYQWDVQSSMVQLKNKLQAEGFKVWMDVDEMGGSTLESMAKAVENASVVLIGVSQKYKESPNCRSEAEYTFQLHRDIIPLMMEKKYKPDGWLGMVVGTKFWIDFSDRYKLDSNVDKLKKELGNRGSLKVQEHVQVATVDVVDAAPRPSINSWKNSQAKQWLVDSGLQKRMNQKAVERLDGPMLIRLQDLRKESPEFFYSALRQDFGLVNVFDVLEFTDALDKLVG